MKKLILRISFLCILSAISINKLFAQAAPDSISVQTDVNQITANFYKAVGQESRLYNGHEYLPYDPHLKGNALFPYDAQSWLIGEVNYDGIVYKGVPMMYDINKDVVVVLLYNKFSMFSLLSERVADFSLGGHHFVRLTADQLANNKVDMTVGFYDQLYGGTTEVLASRKKTLQNSSNAVAAPETRFISTDDYYIKKSGTYYKVSGQGSILKVLKDKKSAIQQYFKQNHIRFKDNPEDAMAKMAYFYDHN